MIVDSVLDGYGKNFFVPIDGLCDSTVYLKCEGLNAAGSIKLKPAMRMVKNFELSGQLRKGGSLIESSSGNLGAALSMIAAARGYNFTCVTDPNASPGNVKFMRAVGANVIIVDEKDCNGGYLGTRIDLIHDMCAADPDLVWVNQYSNPGNWQAHYDDTAPAILREFDKVDHLFVGAGTGGTIMGCARYFAKHSPLTRITAVDVVGSVTFGGKPGPRKIPGLGTSRRPELYDDSLISRVVHVAEPDTVRMCRSMAKRGLLMGGSSGTVLAGLQMCRSEILPTDNVVAIMPDFGANYLTTVYDDEWIHREYGDILRGDNSLSDAVNELRPELAI